MDRRRITRSFLLVWLSSSLLCVTYVTLAVLGGGTPNWLDVLVFSAWVVSAGRRLAPLARPLAHRRIAIGLALALLLAVLLTLALPWALHMPVRDGLWQVGKDDRLYLDFSAPTVRRLLLTVPQTLYVINFLADVLFRAYQQGTASLTTHLQTAALALALGFGLTVLAVVWGTPWQRLLSLPLVAGIWDALSRPFRPAAHGVRRCLRWMQRRWRLARRTGAWRFTSRMARWGLLAVLAR